MNLFKIITTNLLASKPGLRISIFSINEIKFSIELPTGEYCPLVSGSRGSNRVSLKHRSKINVFNDDESIEYELHVVNTSKMQTKYFMI